MKVFIILSAIVAVTLAQHANHAYPEKQRPHIPIVKSHSDVDHDGSYQYGYETAHGIQVQAQGYTKNQGVKDGEIQVEQGHYSYTDPEGHVIQVNYVADENGFQAEGAHLPTPPPIPHEIAEALAKQAANPHQYEEEEHYHQQPQAHYKKY